MKKPYAESTLKKKYKETGIPKKVLEKLHLYFIACAHFYKVISVDEVWKVIQKTERRQGEKELKEILNSTMFECIKNHILEENHREKQDRQEKNPHDSEEIDLNNPDPKVQTKIKKRIEKVVTDGIDGYMKMAEQIATPLTAEGFQHHAGDYVLTREDFDKVIAIKERCCDRYFVLKEDEFYVDGDAAQLYLVAISTMLKIEGGEINGLFIDDAVEILDRSFEKPIYIPDDLLCYIDDIYYEKTAETESMENFLRKEFFSDRSEEDKETETEIRFLIFEMNHIISDVTMSPSGDIDRVSKMLEDNGHIFSDFDSVQQFVSLYMNMANNTRLPVNKGHKPAELVPRERVVNATGTIVKGRKIKPNEPCPCGSGRKYKHCCGRHS